MPGSQSITFMWALYHPKDLMPRSMLVLLLGVAALLATPAAADKVLRVAYLVAETHFDPVTVSDLYSHNVIEEIFDAPLTYDPLARPLVLRPNTLVALPEVSNGGRTYTLRIKPGIWFQDDAAFKGKARELVAADYAYTLRRMLDPGNNSPNAWLIEGKIVGGDAATQAAKKAGKFDYDAPIEGLVTPDRYTLVIHLTKPDYNFMYILAMSSVVAMAREVVQHYGRDIGAHPVGTGPYRLAEWKRSAKIVLTKNPTYREEYYSADPPKDDPISVRLAREMNGKRIPQIDRIEVSIIEESQPRWLAFLNGELDWINLPYEFKSMAMVGNQVAPHLARRGISAIVDAELVTTYLYFNMKDKTLGGYTPEKVALRRALAMAHNIDEEVALIRNGTAMAAQSPIPPGIVGFDAAWRHPEPYNPARAKALLDMYGYVDRDGDGWRDLPDGKPLVFRYASAGSQLDRQFSALWKKNMDAIGVRMELLVERWPELRKMSKKHLLQSWELAWGADYPDAENLFQLFYGPNCGSSNDGCFQLKAFDELYERASTLPPSAERDRLYAEMKRLIAVYVPWKLGTHRTYNYFRQPWLKGWRKHPVLHDTYRWADIDVQARVSALQ
jgi:ABC-type transport system substrate-binding protein